MNEIQNADTDESHQVGIPDHNSSRGGGESRIGLGKRVGLYGCGFMLLGLVIVAVMIYLTGAYVPYQGTEGAGP